MATVRVGYCLNCDCIRELSPRSRCVICEYERSLANEKENEELRKEIERISYWLPEGEGVCI